MFEKLRRPLRDFIVNWLGSSVLINRATRCWLYKLYGIKTRAWKINSKCYFVNKDVDIGEDTFINCGCTFEGPIKIGKHCSIGYEVLMVASEHKIGGSDNRARDTISKPITIGNGVWVAARVTILPGVTIGDGCIIGAGAVVNKNCEANGLYVGVPARRIKDLP